MEIKKWAQKCHRADCQYEWISRVPFPKKCPRCAEWLIYKENCIACGATHNLVKDHIRPLSKGGKDDISNLQTLCNPCNVRKGNRLIDVKSRAFQLRTKVRCLKCGSFNNYHRLTSGTQRCRNCGYAFKMEVQPHDSRSNPAPRRKTLA